MRNKGKSMVMASFVADSLALGAHWIYDTEKIKSDFGRVESLLNPVSDSYHATKGKGGFTHYGDQSFVLLESIATKKGYNPTDFCKLGSRAQDRYGGEKGRPRRAWKRH